MPLFLGIQFPSALSLDRATVTSISHRRFTSRSHWHFTYIQFPSVLYTTARTMFDVQTRLLSWWHETPLPLQQTSARFQTWYHCNDRKWPPSTARLPTRAVANTSPPVSSAGLEIVTWNADAGSPSAGPRMTALLEAIESQTSTDIIFLQH